MNDWLQMRLDREPPIVRRAIAAPATEEVAFPVTTLALRRCGCGTPLPNPFDVRCAACARAGFGCLVCGRPAVGQGLCGSECCRAKAMDLFNDRGDLDDDSEERHWERVDIEADLKDEGQRLDPRAF